MNIDHADKQVTGIDRYFPTTTSKALALATVSAPLAVFGFFQSQMGGLAPTTQSYSKLLLSLSASLSVMLLIASVLILNLTVIIYQSKHSRTRHYTASAPEMNFKWLKMNATKRHYAFLILIFIAGIATGIGYKNL